MTLPPDDQRCRATTKGGMVRGAYWSPPKRCGNYALVNGYCRRHQPPEHPAEDDPGRPCDHPHDEELALAVVTTLAIVGALAPTWVR